MNRRRFLKYAGTTAAVVAASALGLRYSSERSSGIQRATLPEAAIIDAHAHIQWETRSEDTAKLAAKTAVENMDVVGIKKTLIMPPPFPPDLPMVYDYEPLAQAASSFLERFAVLAGGGSLNPMIHSTSPEKVTSEIKHGFEEEAVRIIRRGAVGFGELTAEHFSLHTGHPYESTSPDHPLFLLLADIAASNDVPIDLHMEAVPQDMPMPEQLSSPANPQTLNENIAAFERLLTHNPSTRIIWAHAGWDNTGYRTVGLMREVLERHPNLSMSIVVHNRSLHPENMPLDKNGEVRTQWMDLIRSFPDRFVIGSDIFYGETGIVTWNSSGEIGPTQEKTWDFLKKLPPDLAGKLAYENVVQIYRMN